MYANSEVWTIGRSATALDGVEACLVETPRELQQKKLGGTSKVQGGCMYPKPADDVSRVRLGDHGVEERCKAMMSEFRGDAGESWLRWTRPSQHEEDGKRCMCPWRWTTLVGASQKMKTVQMVTSFELDRCVTMVG